MALITVIAGTTPAQVDEETYEIVKLMVEDLPRPVKDLELAPIIRLLYAGGYDRSAVTIARAARNQVERDNCWTDQIQDDAAFAEQGAQQ